MIDMTYDPEADAAYIRVAAGKVAETAQAGPFVYDMDERGRVLGIEILAASRTLAPGDWGNAPRPARVSDAAE
jgi:uncharacterized protein YuzE